MGRLLLSWIQQPDWYVAPFISLPVAFYISRGAYIGTHDFSQFSASIPGIFYAMLGSSRQLNVGPEAALSLLVGQAITDAMHNNHENPEDFLAVGYKVATAITLQSGLFSFLLGFFRLGFIDVILSRALLTGFVGAVGIVILM